MPLPAPAAPRLPEDFTPAVRRALVRADPVLGSLMKRVGPFLLARHGAAAGVLHALRPHGAKQAVERRVGMLRALRHGVRILTRSERRTTVRCAH